MQIWNRSQKKLSAKPKRRQKCFEENIRYSKVLRQLSKELEDRMTSLSPSEEGDLIDLAELEQIAEEALS